MGKSNIRLVHSMARTGSTVISKCLACMKDVILLSEIHPLGIKQFNPVRQAQQWYNLFTNSELQEYSSQSHTFVSVIRLINDRVEFLGKKLVLRDWAHLDFTAVPFLPEPSYRLMLYESLVNDFNLLRIAITRHPINQWLGLSKLHRVQDRLTLEQFLTDYLRFAQITKEIGFIRYEDFTHDPDAILEQITYCLQLEYDPEYKKNWMNYTNITGDRKNTWREIKPWSHPQLEKSLIKRFTKNNDYRASLKILGYEHFNE